MKSINEAALRIAALQYDDAKLGNIVSRAKAKAASLGLPDGDGFAPLVAGEPREGTFDAVGILDWIDSVELPAEKDPKSAKDAKQHHVDLLGQLAATVTKRFG